MRHRGLEGEAAPQLSGGVPLTAGRGGRLGARGPLGGDVAQFLLQIRKLSPRARKELFWTHSLGRRHRTEPPSRLPYSSPRLASRDWADIQALLDLLVEGLRERACLHSARISESQGSWGGGRRA